MHFITHIGEDFQDADLSFIVVLPPPVGVGYVVQLSLLLVAYSVIRIFVTVTVTKVFILRFLLKDRKCITESFTYIQRSSG